MFDNVLQTQLVRAVASPTCSVLKRAASFEVPKNSNSVVRFSMAHITREVLAASTQLFTEVYSRESSITESYPHLRGQVFALNDILNFSSNLVHVLGAAPEPNHIHSTTIVIQVVEGIGIIFYEKNDKPSQELVEQGDMAVIPVGAGHFFHGDPMITYAGIEFGPVIDYQKHHYL